MPIFLTFINSNIAACPIWLAGLLPAGRIFYFTLNDKKSRFFLSYVLPDWLEPENIARIGLKKCHESVISISLVNGILSFVKVLQYTMLMCLQCSFNPIV